MMQANQRQRWSSRAYSVSHRISMINDTCLQAAPQHGVAVRPLRARSLVFEGRFGGALAAAERPPVGRQQCINHVVCSINRNHMRQYWKALLPICLLLLL